MRVTHVVVTSRFAGVERYVSSVAVELAARGHDVTVVGGAEAPMRALRDASVRWLPGSSLLQALRSLRQVRGSEVLHVHMTKAELAGTVVSAAYGSALVTTRHFAGRRGSGPAGRLFSRGFNRLDTQQIAISRYVAERLERPPDLISLPGTSAADAPYDPTSRTVLVLQRLEREKETALALQAWALAGLADLGWRLRIVGEGAERPALEALVRRHRLDASVDFEGWSDEVERHLRESALLLATTPVEALGLSVLEAMAAGVPVVASAAGGHLETVGAVPGAALYPPGDAAEAARVLRRLAQDPEQRVQLSERGRAHQREHLSVARHVDDLERAYEAALRTRS